MSFALVVLTAATSVGAATDLPRETRAVMTEHGEVLARFSVTTSVVDDRMQQVHDYRETSGERLEIARSGDPGRLDVAVRLPRTGEVVRFTLDAAGLVYRIGADEYVLAERGVRPRHGWPPATRAAARDFLEARVSRDFVSAIERFVEVSCHSSLELYLAAGLALSVFTDVKPHVPRVDRVQAISSF